MWGTKSGEAPRTIVEAEELRDRVRKEVLIACDFSIRRGRPRHSVLGDDRVQMDTETCSRIVGLVVDEMRESGIVLETQLDSLYTAGGRRDYARKLIKTMSAIRRSVISDIPEERLYKSLGDLIRVGKSVKGADGRRSEMRYVSKDSASSIEMTAAWNVSRKRAAESAARASIESDAFASVIPSMPVGVTFGEHVAERVRQYHERQAPDAQNKRAR